MYAFRDPALGPLAEICRACLVVIPIADYDAQDGDGDHWSILLLQRESVETSFHAFRLDSLGDRNKNLSNYFLSLLRESEMCRDCIPESSEVLDGFPSQTNGTDCGCFVCLAALHIAEVLREGVSCNTPFVFPQTWDTEQFRRNLLQEALSLRH
ncbi:Ulp1 protease family [Trypanosoma melophagium]|uniref:Ulp1 protease family n=1 Tax=Trypanosoma melophagium TaxID=715481 RepID=UPI00351A4AF6|nr:Ulp1 protease family [Trypanosoma melophagium]